MKIIYTATAIVLAGIVFANAEGLGRDYAQPRQNTDRIFTNPELGLFIKTGDSALDDQIKALNKEMELKIQAIHSEYITKIKEIVANKVASSTSASTTPRLKKELRFEHLDASSTFGTSTLDFGRDIRQREMEGAGIGSRIQNFLRNIFGRN